MRSCLNNNLNNLIMTRENLKNQVNSKIVNDELSEEEMMHDIMQMVDAHVTQQLRIGSVSDTLIAWQRFRDANWYESDSVDVDKMLMDKFQEIYGR